MKIRKLVEKAHQNAKDKGWWDDTGMHAAVPTPSVAEKLLMIHSEVSEATEDLRRSAMRLEYEVSPSQGVAKRKPVGFPSELADIVIRVADLAGGLGIDLEKAIKEKMAYNATRSHRHGNKAL